MSKVGVHVAVAVLGAAFGVLGTLAAIRDPRVAETQPVEDPTVRELAAEIATLDSALAQSRERIAELTDDSPTRAPVLATGSASPASPGPPSDDTRSQPSGPEANSPPEPPPQPDMAAATSKARAWQAQLRQTGDPGSANTAWADVRSALVGSDPTSILAALRVVAYTTDVRRDRHGLRDLILRSVESEQPDIRLAAWTAIINTELIPGDIERMCDQITSIDPARQPDMVQRIAWATTRGGKRIEGATAQSILRVLDDPNLTQDTVRALGGTALGDQTIARVMEYARSSEEAAAHATHFVFRTLPDKPHDVVAFLLDRAQGGDLSGIELLGSTIRKEDVAYAGERLRKICDASDQSWMRGQLIQAIAQIGDEGSRVWLERLRDDDAQPSDIRAAATGALQRLDRARR